MFQSVAKCGHWKFTSQPRFSEPDLTGFLVEGLKQQKYNSTINGAQYEIVELPYALFPTSDGEFVIGAAQMEIAVRASADPFDPNSFFQNFFGRSQVVRLNTRPIPVRVRALPKNKPPAFSGAVGRYKLTSKLEANEPEVGKRGRENLNGMALPRRVARFTLVCNARSKSPRPTSQETRREPNR